MIFLSKMELQQQKLLQMKTNGLLKKVHQILRINNSLAIKSYQKFLKSYIIKNAMFLEKEYLIMARHGIRIVFASDWLPVSYAACRWRIDRDPDNYLSFDYPLNNFD